MAVYCSKCGKQQPGDAIFCMGCGQPLKADGQSIQATGPVRRAAYGNRGYQPTQVQPPSAYGNYGQEAQRGYGVPPPQKKSRTGLVIGLTVLLLVLVLVGAGIGGYFILRSTPEKTLQAYCNALLNSDAQGLDDQLSTREQTNVANIAAGLKRANDPSIGGIKTCTYSNVQQNGSNATATITFTVGNTTLPVYTDNVVMIDENGSWKIDGGQDPAFT